MTTLPGRTQQDWVVRFFALVGSFALFTVEMGIRLMIFAIPVVLVAQWYDVQPTWKLVGFMAFFGFWHDCVFGGKDGFAGQGDRSSVDKRKAAATVLTPAQVAAEARKLRRQSKSGPDL